MQTIHVVVGVIINNKQEVLIALRQKHQHYGGYWEFPGGKVEPGEDELSALARECLEEVDLSIQQPKPLTKFNYQYPERYVHLSVWHIEHFSGKAKGCEGQVIKWVSLADLVNYRFPPANQQIINALLTAQAPVFSNAK